jgi:hypothetical protein
MSEPHTELRAMIEQASGWAEDWYRGHDALGPIWHMVTRDGRQILTESTPDAGNKDLSVMLMRAAFKHFDVVRYVLVDEAWTVMLKAGDEAGLALARKHGVANHPDRVEVVLFQGEDASGQLTASRVIERRPGRRLRLGKLTIDEFTQSSGRFVGMLPPQGRAQ